MGVCVCHNLQQPQCSYAMFFFLWFCFLGSLHGVVNRLKSKTTKKKHCVRALRLLQIVTNTDAHPGGFYLRFIRPSSHWTQSRKVAHTCVRCELCRSQEESLCNLRVQCGYDLQTRAYQWLTRGHSTKRLSFPAEGSQTNWEMLKSHHEGSWRVWDTTTSYINQLKWKQQADYNLDHKFMLGFLVFCSLLLFQSRPKRKKLAWFLWD